MTYTNQSKDLIKLYRKSLASAIADEKYTHYITLTWNSFPNKEGLRYNLRGLLHGIDRALIGRRCHRASACWRSDAVFVCEKMECYPHVHGLIRPAFAEENLSRFEAVVAGGLWQKLVAGGGCDVQRISDCDHLAGYLVKAQNPQSPSDDIIWSSEFHRG